MDNRITIILLLSLSLLGCKGKDTTLAQEDKFEWKNSAWDHNEFKSAIDSLSYKIDSGEYGFIDEVFISRNDSIVYQKEFNLNYTDISKGIRGKMGCGSNACEDSSKIHIYNYYHPKYHPYYVESNMHTLQSITKSVASTIVGAAINNGDLASVEAPVYQFFTNYELTDSLKRHLEATTIKDVLTMQLGLVWKEFGMSLEMETNVSEMELTEDWIRYILNQPIETTPGNKWNYNSGASQLLAEIIKGATSQTIEDYGNRVLFEKLGIDAYYWKKTPLGLPDTEGGLYLNAEDLAKIGLLHLQDGIWNEERLLPKNWVKEAFDRQVKDIYQDGGKEGYGYQWWITGDEPPLAVGLGYGNQILVIIPAQNIVGVVYAWNVFDNKAKYIFRDFVDVLNTADNY